MRMICVSAAVSLLLASGPGGAASVLPQNTPDSYAQPGQQIAIAAGRVLNMRCEGTGPGTVVLEAGSNADSSTWFRVQPSLSAYAKVCSYDRAGYGFSAAGPLPRNLEADVDDLHALIKAAGLGSPLVLVGHSRGSNIVRRYAQRYPADVAGLVLVDPPEQGAQAQLPAQWRRDDDAMLAQRNAFLDACEQAAVKDALDSAEGAAKGCLRAPPEWQSDAVAATTRAYKLKPDYWRTLRSELADNQAIFAMPLAPDETYGSLPLMVLTSPNDERGVPDEVRNVMARVREQTWTDLVAASRQGVRVPVENTSHDIQIDQPVSVVDAVRMVLATLPEK